MEKNISILWGSHSSKKHQRTQTSDPDAVRYCEEGPEAGNRIQRQLP